MLFDKILRETQQTEYITNSERYYIYRWWWYWKKDDNDATSGNRIGRNTESDSDSTIKTISTPKSKILKRSNNTAISSISTNRQSTDSSGYTIPINLNIKKHYY